MSNVFNDVCKRMNGEITVREGTTRGTSSQNLFLHLIDFLNLPQRFLDIQGRPPETQAVIIEKVSLHALLSDFAAAMIDCAGLKHYNYTKAFLN